MIITKHSKYAYIIKDLFDGQEISDIYDEVAGSYNLTMSKKERSGGESDPQWRALFKVGSGVGDNPLLLKFAPRIKIAALKTLKPTFPIHLDRINTNLQYKYQDSTFHTDGGTNDSGENIWTWTFMICAQTYWNTAFGGEFCYQDFDGDYHYIPYIPGNCIFFNGLTEHKGNAPNTMATVPRLTIAYTFRNYDISTADPYKEFD